MAGSPISEQSVVTAWTPDLFGPIFKKESLTLKKVRWELFMKYSFFLN